MVIKESPRSGEIWKHYKGNYYEIIAIGIHTETQEEMVVYEDSGPTVRKYWIRPLSMWMEDVECNGRAIPRFKRVL